jgi:hypothetical protein
MVPIGDENQFISCRTFFMGPSVGLTVFAPHETQACGFQKTALNNVAMSKTVTHFGKMKIL